MVITHRNDCPPFTTKDGSTIRELLASRNSAGVIQNQSLAEATLPVGTATQPHYHPRTEEIYYILQGTGKMRFPGIENRVVAGAIIAIPPGIIHQIENIGEESLVFLCCCAPEYSHEDTVMVESL